MANGTTKSSTDSIKGLGEKDALEITFLQTKGVPDHEVPERQTVTKVVPDSQPCQLYKNPQSRPTYRSKSRPGRRSKSPSQNYPQRSHKSRSESRPRRRSRSPQSPPKLAHKSSRKSKDDDIEYLLVLEKWDPFAISIWAPQNCRKAYKLEIKIGETNIANPSSDTCFQSYFVTPPEQRIDGIAVQVDPRLVRQFVVGRNFGDPIDCQVARKNHRTATEPDLLRIDVTTGYAVRELQESCVCRSPHKLPCDASKGVTIFVKSLTGKTYAMQNTDPEILIEHIKCKIWEYTRIPVESQLLFYSGKDLEDGMTLQDYKITKESTFHLTMRLYGGGPPKMGAIYHTHESERDQRGTPGSQSQDTERDIAIYAGGLIQQPLNHNPGIYEWDLSSTQTLRVRVINSVQFKSLIGSDPPGRHKLPNMELSYGSTPLISSLRNEITPLTSVAQGHHEYRNLNTPVLDDRPSHSQQGNRYRLPPPNSPDNTRPHRELPLARNGSETSVGTNQSLRVGGKGLLRFCSCFVCWK